MKEKSLRIQEVPQNSNLISTSDSARKKLQKFNFIKNFPSSEIRLKLHNYHSTWYLIIIPMTYVYKHKSITTESFLRPSSWLSRFFLVLNSQPTLLPLSPNDQSTCPNAITFLSFLLFFFFAHAECSLNSNSITFCMQISRGRIGYEKR